MANMDHLDRVVSDLERDQNLRRIKKLLYCSCYGVWEDNPARLEQVTLRDIVQGVWERSPTLDALQFQLNRIVKTLNKPVEYAHVANAVLRVMTQLYRDTYDITRPLHRPAAPGAASSPSPPNNATQWLGSDQATANPQAQREADLEAQAIRTLSNHAETVRLKKLLICVCKNYWESDAVRLTSIHWDDLLRETQDLIPTLENLDYVLQAIVKSLSKPLDYLPIASALLQAIRPLYQNRPKPTETLFYGIDNHPAKAPEPTEFYAAPAHDPAGSYPSSGTVGHTPLGLSEAPATAPLAPHDRPHGRPHDNLAGAVTAPLSPPPPHLAQNPSHSDDDVPTGLIASLELDPAEPARGPVPGAMQEAADSPGLLDFAPSHGNLESLPAEAIAPDNETPEPTTADPARLAALQHNRAPENRASEPSGAAGAPSPVGIVPPASSQERDDFGLRLELMRYANPLMVKIVVFSTIHRLFRFSEQDWTELRHHTLNGLMTTLCQNYPNFTDLEAKLCLTAEQIELQDNALKTVAAILKVLKPYYGDNTPERQFSLMPTPVDSLEDDLAILAAALEDEDEADENSCQVF